MPIRVTQYLFATTISDAILFAVDNGAHIISNSWVIPDTSNPNHFPVVVDAIQYAVTQGRGGLGSIMVFGAGNTARHDQNDPGVVRFPSNVTIPGVFTVGASDRDDLQANYSLTSDPNSPNNQIIDIVAPSNRANPPAFGNTEHNEVWTIDIPGNPGRNPSKNQVGNIPAGEQLPDTGLNFLAYTGRFGGTSASTPQIAGIAALVLSVNPNLTQWEVFKIITGTADQVGGYNYINGRSNELGNGRANACKAVYAATASVVGPDYLCSTNTFTLQNPPQGATVSWTAFPSNLFSNDGDMGATAKTGPASLHNRGFGTITFLIETDCGEVEITKTVWVGTPSFTNPTVDGNPYIIGSCHGVCPGFHQAEVTIGGLTNAMPPDVNWQLSGGPVSWSWDHFTSRITFEVQPMTSFPFSLNGTATNPCGSTPFTFCFISGPNCPMGSYALSPNPADGEVVVTNQAATEEDTDQAVEILIISHSFETVYSMTAKGKKIRVPTGQLPNGQYVLQISDKNGVYRKHLIIRH